MCYNWTRISAKIFCARLIGIYSSLTLIAGFVLHCAQHKILISCTGGFVALLRLLASLVVYLSLNKLHHHWTSQLLQVSWCKFYVLHTRIFFTLFAFFHRAPPVSRYHETFAQDSAATDSNVRKFLSFHYRFILSYLKGVHEKYTSVKVSNVVSIFNHILLTLEESKLTAAIATTNRALTSLDTDAIITYKSRLTSACRLTTSARWTLFHPTIVARQITFATRIHLLVFATS
jgi:hypothetical protein